VVKGQRGPARILRVLKAESTYGPLPKEREREILGFHELFNTSGGGKVDTLDDRARKWQICRVLSRRVVDGI